MTKRPTPQTVGDLVEVCKHVTAPGTWLEYNAMGLRTRLEEHADGVCWQNVPEKYYSKPLDDETRVAFEQIRAEWEVFRDAMIRVFGE